MKNLHKWLGIILIIPPLFALAADRPNIVLILSDDMGYSDIGCYGSEIATPNLDKLATHGLRFTQFYNTARCCPTRASLLTGLYPHQAGVGHMMADRGHDGYRGELNRRCVTIPEALKPAGYRSYAVGKWHITKRAEAEKEADKSNWPLQRGFDRYYGTITGAGSFWDPSTLTRDNKAISAFNDPEYEPQEYYYTDAISDHAVRFIRDHSRDFAQKPYLLYVAYTAAHWPMHAKESDIAKYKGKYSDYESVRAARWSKQKALGVIDPKWELPPHPISWADIKNKAFETRCMEVYAAMVDSMDQGIGRIMAELQRQKQLDNTLIFYLQDNGGCAEVMGRNGPFKPRPGQPTLPAMTKADLQHGIAPKQTRDGYPVRQGYGVLPGPPDTYVAYGRGWANVSNTPFREYKHWVHEGGISTPLIVHWPSRIRASRRNQLVHEPAHLIDIMATCLEVAGAKYPEEFQGERITPAQGVSLIPVLSGKALKRKEPIFWEHEGNPAVREGKWKLVAKENQPWELYNVEADRSEMRNVATNQARRVKALASKWDAWAARANVLPLGTWRGKRPAGTNAANAFPKFSLHQIDGIGNSLGQTALADIDRDGDLDWISGCASYSGSNIWWWEYRGPEQWVRHLLGRGNTDVGGAAHDVNGDGWIDFLSGSKLLLNTGKPAVEEFRTSDPGTIHSHDTIFADVNGDGRMDGLANSDRSGLFWYEIPKDASQSWKSHPIATAKEHKVHGGISPKSVGDLDGDGDSDVVTAQAWYENEDGKGLRWKQHQNIDFGQPDRFGIMVRTFLADLDSDDDLDIIQAEGDSVDGRVGWFENDGRGSWTRHLIKDKGDRQDFHSLAVADFDNDGDLDVFSGGGPLTAAKDFKCYIWENTAALGTRPIASVWREHIVARKHCHEAVAADVDQDGDIDICFKPWSKENEHIYLQNLLINAVTKR